MDPYRKWIETENISTPNPYEDPDHDGIETALEWAFGLDPDSSDKGMVLVPTITNDQSGISIGGEWVLGARGVGFSFSDDMAVWEPFSAKDLDQYPWLEAFTSEQVAGQVSTEIKLVSGALPPRFFRFRMVQQ